MIISTTRIDASRRRSVTAFTLVELLIALPLGMLVMAGVISSFLLLGRSGMNVVHYSLAEAEIRRGIEDFSRDVRMARAIRWNDPASITLTVPDNYTATANQVTYAYDNSSSGPTAGCFYRVPGGSGSTAARTIYVREVSQFSFSRFNRLNTAALTDADTKRVQITMNVRRTRSTLVAANTTLVSASYTLRNKVIN